MSMPDMFISVLSLDASPCVLVPCIEELADIGMIAAAPLFDDVIYFITIPLNKFLSAEE